MTTGSSVGTSSILGASGLAGDSLLDRDGAAANHELDDLWLAIRNFFDDLTSKGDKREIGRLDRANKLKFTDACESFDFEKSGVISEANVLTAFNRSRFTPLPTKQ